MARLKDNENYAIEYAEEGALVKEKVRLVVNLTIRVTSWSNACEL